MSAAKHTPMVVAAARALCKRGAEQCNVDFEDSWKVYGDLYLEDAQAALQAANAQELIRALKECAAVCAGEMTTKNDLINALELARAALAKATGGAA